METVETMRIQSHPVRRTILGRPEIRHLASVARRQKIRKPSVAQTAALAWLVEARDGIEWYDECRAIARPVTWAAMERAGWVKRDEHWRIVATDAGREVIAPTLLGRAQGREIIAQIKREAADRLSRNA